MIVGILKEIKTEENCVSMTPAGVEVMRDNGVIHYCVSNMPGAVAKTSTMALTNATLPYAVEIAKKVWKKAMKDNPEIKPMSSRAKSPSRVMPMPLV